MLCLLFLGESETEKSVQEFFRVILSEGDRGIWFPFFPQYFTRAIFEGLFQLTVVVFIFSVKLIMHVKFNYLE